MLLLASAQYLVLLQDANSNVGKASTQVVAGRLIRNAKLSGLSFAGGV
jgi:hypothetical protein